MNKWQITKCRHRRNVWHVYGPTLHADDCNRIDRCGYEFGCWSAEYEFLSGRQAIAFVAEQISAEARNRFPVISEMVEPQGLNIGQLFGDLNELFWGRKEL